MGPLIWYCAICTFVIASYDQEAATNYCVIAACDVKVIDENGQPLHYNPMTPGNLYPAPVLDYFCCFFWIINGLILSKRGQIILQEINDAEKTAKDISEFAASVQAGDVGEAIPSAAP
jgi:hypothetical protein